MQKRRMPDLKLKANVKIKKAFWHRHKRADRADGEKAGMLDAAGMDWGRNI